MDRPAPAAAAAPAAADGRLPPRPRRVRRGVRVRPAAVPEGVAAGHERGARRQARRQQRLLLRGQAVAAHRRRPQEVPARQDLRHRIHGEKRESSKFSGLFF